MILTNMRDTGSNLSFRQGIRPHCSHHRPVWHSVSSSLSFGIEIHRKVQSWGFRQKTTVRPLSSSAASFHVRYLNLTIFFCISPQCILEVYWWGSFWGSLYQVKCKGRLRPNSSSSLLWLDTKSWELHCGNAFGELSHLLFIHFIMPGNFSKDHSWTKESNRITMKV